MTEAVSPFLRPPRLADAGSVFSAFASNDDMRRQGDVMTVDEAERYVARLLSAGAAHQPWAICVDDQLVGLVNIGADEANRNGWFSYWMHAEARGGVPLQPLTRCLTHPRSERGRADHVGPPPSSSSVPVPGAAGGYSVIQLPLVSVT
ncbi:GNAT family N-acetyltransferase [Nocardiopsis valliformis]|uniref:GNAT family N-acetyltransferase n=1 Tax=Nocardiopsis valliformis TaxID=239974 RepID=UPI001269708F|nr:GNAT family N-acetyltransferase [Nocardiopsis valliformis]